MIRPGRNDPCPCGSGRKYKRCCQGRDRTSDEQATRAERLRSAAEDVWSVEAVPLIVSIAEAGSERPVSILVVAGGMILHQELLGRLGGDAADVAKALAGGIRKAAGRVGFLPDRVRVRHREVRAALAPMLADEGVDVEFRASLPDLEEVALGLMEAMGSPPFWPPTGRSDSWLGWDLPRPLMTELFEAAADFWEEAPWEVVENMQAPRCELPSGRAWTCMVLGNAGLEFGVVLHSEHADAFERPGLDDPELGFEGISGRMLSMIFEPLSDMPKRARKEIATLRLRLADTRACPDLMTVNTPGGGVSEAEARDLLLLLRAVPRFARRHGPDLEREMETLEPADLDWTDPETGVSFRYRGESVEEAGPVGPMSGMSADVRAEIQRVIEEVHRELEAEGGAGALDPDILSARAGERIRDRMDLLNAMPQPELGGLSPEQVGALLSADWGVAEGSATDGDVAEASADDAVSDAVRLRYDLTEGELEGVPAHEGMRALLELADEGGGLGRTEAGYLKVAVVRAWMDRVKDRVPEWADLEETLVGKRRWEVDIPGLHWLRVLAELDEWLRPWGGRFVLTRDGRRLLESGREGERYARMFETCFRRFNLGYESMFEWPEGQHQAAFTLYRIGDEALDWVTGRELLERRTVVPFAKERLPVRSSGDGEWILEIHLLRPLARFGLVERRRDEDRRDLYRVTPRYMRFLEFGV